MPIRQVGRQSVNPTNPSNVITLVNKKGFHVNRTQVVTNSRIDALNRLEIGSQEGNGRSKVIYKYIKVVKYPTT